MTDRRTFSTNGFINGRPCRHCGGVVRYASNGGCANKNCRKERRLACKSEDLAAYQTATRAHSKQASINEKVRREKALTILTENLDIPACREVFILLSPNEAKMRGLNP